MEKDLIHHFACGIRKTAQGIRNPTNDWNPESKFHRQRLLEYKTWNPESKTVLDIITWGDSHVNGLLNFV